MEPVVDIKAIGAQRTAYGQEVCHKKLPYEISKQPMNSGTYHHLHIHSTREETSDIGVGA